MGYSHQPGISECLCSAHTHTVPGTRVPLQLQENKKEHRDRVGMGWRGGRKMRRAELVMHVSDKVVTWVVCPERADKSTREVLGTFICQDIQPF